MIKILLLLAILLLIGCGENEENKSFWVENGETILEDKNGNRIKKGLHVGWPIEATVYFDGKEQKLDESSRILGMLEKEEIEVEFVDYFDEKMMTWKRKDDECVRKIVERNSWCTQESNKKRNEMDGTGVPPNR